jgi:hypothetical protein
MSPSPEYQPGGQRQWHRVEVAWSPRGHAFTTRTSSGDYFAWQLNARGPFLLRRVSSGVEFGPVNIPDFNLARLTVAQVEASLAGHPLTEGRLRELVASQYGGTTMPEPLGRALAGPGLVAFLAGPTGVLTGKRQANPTISVSGPVRSTISPTHRIRKRVLR